MTASGGISMAVDIDMNRIRNPAAAVLALTSLAALYLLVRPLIRTWIRRWKVRVVSEALHRRSTSSSGCAHRGPLRTDGSGSGGGDRGRVTFDPRRGAVPPDLLRDLLDRAAGAARGGSPSASSGGGGGPPTGDLDYLRSRGCSAASFVITSERDRLDELADVHSSSSSSSPSDSDVGVGCSSSGFVTPSLRIGTVHCDSARVIRSCSAVVTFAVDLAPLKRWFDLSGGMRAAELAGFGSDLGNPAAYHAAWAETQRAAENFASLCHAAGLEGTYLGRLSSEKPPTLNRTPPEGDNSGREHGGASPSSPPPSSTRARDADSALLLLSPADRLHDFLGLPPKLSVVVASYAVGWPASPRLCCGAWGGGLRCKKRDRVDDDYCKGRGSSKKKQEDTSRMSPPRPQPARIFDETYGTMTAVEVLEHHECLESGWREREERRWRKASRRRLLERTRTSKSSSAAQQNNSNGGLNRRRSSALVEEEEEECKESINDDQGGGVAAALDGELFQDNDEGIDADIESNLPPLPDVDDSAIHTAPGGQDSAQVPQPENGFDGFDDGNDIGSPNGDDDGGFGSFLSTHSIDSAAQYLCLAGGFAGRDLRYASRVYLEGIARRGFRQPCSAGGAALDDATGPNGGYAVQGCGSPEHPEDSWPCSSCGRISHVHASAAAAAAAAAPLPSPSSSSTVSGVSSPTHGGGHHRPTSLGGGSAPNPYRGGRGPWSGGDDDLRQVLRSREEARRRISNDSPASDEVLDRFLKAEHDEVSTIRDGDGEEDTLGQSLASLSSYNPAPSSVPPANGGAPLPLPPDSIAEMEMEMMQQSHPHSLAA